MKVRRHELTDEQWERIAGLLPAETRPKGQTRNVKSANGERDHVDSADGRTIGGDLPERYPPWKSVYTRFSRWSKQGIWERVLKGLAEGAPAARRTNRWDDRPRAPRCAWGTKRGDERIGRSRGGPTTKIHAVVDSAGRPFRLALTDGHAHDVTMAPQLLAGLRRIFVIADKAYDSDAVRQQLRDQKGTAVIPSRSNRRRKSRLNKPLYRRRHLVENFFPAHQALPTHCHALRETRGELSVHAVPRRSPDLATLTTRPRAYRRTS